MPPTVLTCPQDGCHRLPHLTSESSVHATFELCRQMRQTTRVIPQSYDRHPDCAPALDQRKHSASYTSSRTNHKSGSVRRCETGSR